MTRLCTGIALLLFLAVIVRAPFVRVPHDPLMTDLALASAAAFVLAALFAWRHAR